MKIKDVFKLLAIYFVLFCLGSLFYVLSMRTFFLSNISVFFYRGIAVIIFWGVIISLIMFLLKKIFWNKIITIRDIILIFCAFCCIHVVIFTHLPVTADRSISVFMLGYMAQGEEEYTKEEIEDIFIDKYVYDFEAFEKRLDEQVYSGTIKENEEGKYEITNSGRRIISIYEVIIKWFKLEDKLVHPKDYIVNLK